MFRTKLTLAGLAAVAALGTQAAVAQARSSSPTVRPFITDTLAPGGSITVPRSWFSFAHRWFVIEHSNPAAQQPQGYRFITDTLAPGGGTSVAPAPASNGFDWGDAGIGAGATAGLMLALLASLRLTQRRSPVAV